MSEGQQQDSAELGRFVSPDVDEDERMAKALKNLPSHTEWAIEVASAALFIVAGLYGKGRARRILVSAGDVQISYGLREWLENDGD